MPRFRRSALLITACVVVAALAGCAAPVPDPTPTPTPTAPPLPEPMAGPTPRIDVACDDIIDPEALQAFVGFNTRPLAPVAPADRLTPDHAAVEQLGGLTCSWTNGLPGSYFAGPHPDTQDVLLRILPDGLDAAIAYVDLYRLRDATYGDHVQGPRCVEPQDGADRGYCELFGIIGQTWVELTVIGIAESAVAPADLVSGFREVIDPMLAAIGSMSPRERWTPEAPSALTGSDCATLAPTGAIIDATTIPDLLVGLRGDGPHVGQYWYSVAEVGALRCSLGVSWEEWSVGEIGILPSGAWAFDRFADAWRADGGIAIDVAGVPSGDAISRCDDDTSTDCVIDFTLGGDWLRVTVYPTPRPDVEYSSLPADYFESARAAAPEIARIVAEQVAAS